MGAGEQRTVGTLPCTGRGGAADALETVYQERGTLDANRKHDALYPMMYYKDRLFYPFVDDWVAQGNGRIVVPGLGPYQMIELGWSLQDILNQIDHTREHEVHGQAFFRADNVLSNTKGMLDELAEYYRYPAKLPPMDWLSDTIPERPNDLRAERDEEGLFQLSWEAQEKRVTYNVYRGETDSLVTDNAERLMAAGLRQSTLSLVVPDDDTAYYYYVTTSDSYNIESEPSIPAFFYHSETIK